MSRAGLGPGVTPSWGSRSGGEDRAPPYGVVEGWGGQAETKEASWARGPISYWGRGADEEMLGCTLRPQAVDKQGLEEEDVLELGGGEFEVPGDEPGWEICCPDARGSSISLCSTQGSGILDRGRC